MRYLPRIYHESQNDWFGKRGNVSNKWWMNLYSSFSIQMRLTSKWVICGWDRTSAYAGAAGSCYQSISDLWWGMTTTPGTPCPTYGIPWHISVAFRKRADQNKLLTFCHIFKSCTQDTSTVLAVMANVIQQRKSTMPRMDTVFYRQGQCWVLPLRGQHCWRKHHRTPTRCCDPASRFYRCTKG